MSLARDPFPPIKSVEIKRWGDLEKRFDDYLSDPGRWVFRGQERSDWPLSTRIERELAGIGRGASACPYPEGLHGASAIGVLDRIELFVARAFQARASELMHKVPDKEDTLELLSLMQHWGFPTRLLDVTASPYVALHFAVTPHLRRAAAGGTAAVYAINSVFLRGIASRIVGASTHVNFDQRDTFRQYFFVERPEHLFVAPVHSVKVDARMAAQQACFLIPTTIYEPFEKCLTQQIGSNDVVTKLLLSEEVITEAQRRLIRMNIHEASLFPDIHGYGRLVTDSIQALKRHPVQNWHLKLEALESFRWPS